MRTHVLLAASLALASAAAGGDKAPAKPEPTAERFTYRVTGLFDRQRVKDLRAVFEGMPEIALVAVDFDEAEATLEFIPAKVFPGTKPDKLAEAVDQKVRQATRGAFGVRPRRTVPREKLQQVVIPIAGCDCRGCSLAAYAIVAKIDGVYQATASFKEGRLTALIDPEKTDKSQLEAALQTRNVDIGKPKK